LWILKEVRDVKEFKEAPEDCKESAGETETAKAVSRL
jgi:hypothetical protein